MMRSDYDESKENARIVPQALSAAVLLIAAMLVAFLISSRAFAVPAPQQAPCTDRYAVQAGVCTPADAQRDERRSGLLR